VQEALQNALRHSNCSLVKISTSSNNDQAAVNIEDNGKGFHPRGLDKAGNGLDNMRARAAEAGFKLQISSGKDLGSSVSIRAEGGGEK